METQKIILIGQAPAVGDGPGVPFGGRPGKSLALLMSVDYEKLGDYFERLDVFAATVRKPGERGDRFDFAAAREEIKNHQLPLIRGRLVVFLGKKVANVFGRAKMPPFVWETDQERGFTYALYPHPSGRDEFWNHPENVRAAKAFFAEITRVASP